MGRKAKSNFKEEVNQETFQTISELSIVAMKMIKLLGLGNGLLYFNMESFHDNANIKSMEKYLHSAAVAPESRVKVFQVKQHSILGSF